MKEKKTKTSEIKYPYLSVVIPAFNSEKTIEKCIIGVMEASPKNKEIIVVDDASTDNTYEIVSRFPVALYRLTENSGPAVARNYGFAQSTGDIVVFVDSDVIIGESSLEALIRTLKEKRAGATGGLPRPIRSNLISDSYVARIFGKSPIAETGIRETKNAGGGLVAY
ncbi:MAG: glycosyltransferase, partial [Candidatus Aenigmarchaeota archaeon]|nr:glycosyltransferase [Candidatus Aenigmarchaeota archaeon]